MLLSGGLDSSTTLAIAKSEGFRIHALTVAYGQRHKAEIEAAGKVARSLGVIEHKLIAVDLDAFGGSALTGGIAVPKDREESQMKDIPVTYVPARNTVMLALALGYAESIGAQDIFLGVNAIDYSGYPDCRPEFVQAFERLANLATKMGVEGRSIRIHAPLISWTKTQIIEEGLKLGVDFSLTHSCYDPLPDGRPCGRCDSCRIRQRAFASMGMKDPVYA